MAKQKKGYVITGDIENFTQIDTKDRELLIGDAKLFLESLVQKQAYAEVFRGDSYQLFFTSKKKCLEALLKIKCWFLTYRDFELQVRNALGVGEVAFISENILQSDGEAFHLSGRTFDELPKGDFLSIKTGKENLNQQLRIITLLVNILLSKWTVQQAQVVFKALEDKNQTEIAKELAISQGAVNNRLKLSNWKEIREAFNYIQNTL